MLSFFLANVRDGVGPYMAMYLLSEKHWNASSIGIAMAIPGFVRIISQSPAGIYIDRTRWKRFLIILSSITVAICCMVDILLPYFQTIVVSQVVIGLATSVYTPTIAAITLGIVGYGNLSSRIGRNESFNHFGNVINALVAGLIGHFTSYSTIFYLIAFMCIASSLSVLMINKRDIDHSRARAETDEGNHLRKHTGFWELLTQKNIIIFSGAIFLFSLANGAILSLVGQKLCIINKEFACAGMSACIICAQLVMMFVARFTGKVAIRSRRKQLFLLSYAVVPVRAFLYTITDDAAFTIAIQVLDGIGGGIFGVLSVVIIADLTEGTGRFNFTQGVMTAIIGIGTAVSSYISGYLVHEKVYDQGFIFLSVTGILAFLFVLFFFSETRGIRKVVVAG